MRKRWDPNPDRQRLYDWAAGLETWRAGSAREPQTGRYRRGVGVAMGYWLYLWQLGTKVELAIEGGRLVAATAVQDIGTGTRSVIADTVAREFGLDPHEVEVRIGNSNLPEGPTSGGSRVTASIVPPLLVAAGKLKAGIAEKTGRKPAPGSNAPWRELIAASPDLKVEAGRAEDNSKTAYGNNSLVKDAGMIGWIFGFMMRRSSGLAIGAGAPSSVQVIEVEVDTLLGHVRVVRAHSGVAVGKLAAPTLARNQAAGAIIQGLGYALYEGREIDRTDRRCSDDRPRRLPHARHRRHSADRRVFRRGRLRPCAWRQRRHRRGRDRTDLGGDRQRHPQRDRRQAARDPDPARPALDLLHRRTAA